MVDLKAETLCYKMGDVKAKALIYQLADTLTQFNPLVHVETDAMVVKLAATLSKNSDADTLQRDIIANSKTNWPATKRSEVLSTNRHLHKHFGRQ